MSSDEQQGIDIWARVDASVFTSPATAVKNEEKPKDPSSRWRRAHWPVLNGLAALAWLWVVVKVFLGDADRWLMAAIAPQWQWLLDYRFMGFLAVVALLSIVIRRKSWWIPAFIVFWPLAVVLFYLPRFLYRRKSPLLAVGVIHTIFGFFRTLRFTLVSVAVTAFAVLGIVASDVTWLLVSSATALAVVWVVSLGKTVRYAVSPGRFVSSQRRLWRRLYSSDAFWVFVHVDEKLKHPAIQAYDKEQTNALVTSLSAGLACTRVAQLWATQLEAYRRSPVTILFGCLAVFGLFLQGVFTFTLVNMAVYKIEPSQFVTSYDPTLATFAYYAFASASFGEISALIPKGNIATAINLATGVGSGVIVLMLVVALILGFRQTRTDEVATRAIDQMRVDAEAFETRLAVEYGLGADALWKRLEELGGGLLSLVPFLLVRSPGRTPRASRGNLN